METKRTLLITTDSFLPRWDGISRFLKEIIPFLETQYDIVIAAPRFTGDLKDFQNCTLIRFPLSKINVADTTLAKPNRKVIKRLVKNSDIVWSQSIGPIGSLSMVYAKKFRKPLISFVHSVEWDLFSKSLKRFKKFIEVSSKQFIRYVYNKCSLIMVPFEGMIPLLEAQSINAPKQVVCLGTDENRFTPPENKADAKKHLNLDHESIVIGYLGRFGREKNLTTLYQAFRKIHKTYPNTTLLLVGGKLDKPFDNMESIKVIPSVDNPVPYYQAMDMYVLPSLTETTSLTTMEAMSCEVPVVATPVGYVESYIEHKKNGYLFPKENVERLTIILEKLIKSSAERRRIAKNARKTILRSHSWNHTAEKIKTILAKF